MRQRIRRWFRSLRWRGVYLLRDLRGAASRRVEQLGFWLVAQRHQLLKRVGAFILGRTFFVRQCWGSADYDTREGIARLVTTLAGFNKLIELRRDAHYDRGETLHKFYIKGRWMVDECGNTYRIAGDFIPAEKIRILPDVLTDEELWGYIKEYTMGCTLWGEDIFIQCSLGGNVPPAELGCHECGRLWTIDDCHDTSVEHYTENLPLGEYVGKTLGEVKAIYAARSDAAYRIYGDLYRAGANDRIEGVDDSYVIQEGDEATLYVWRYFHKSCRRRFNAKREREYFANMFVRAGFVNFTLKEVANQYCGCEQCAPWFEASTPIGTILIGWRKRVINIDWGGCFPDRLITGYNKRHDSFLHLFDDEDVTKGAYHIHAWGTEKAIEYLNRMLVAVRKAVVEHFEHTTSKLGWRIYRAGTDEEITTAEEYWQHFLNSGLIDYTDNHHTSYGVVIDYRLQ